MPSTQTRRKRKIGQLLARLRDSSGHTADEVGKVLHRTQSQVSKMENGYNLCAFAELTTMLLLYSATDEQRAEAESLWEDAKQDSTRIAHSSAVPPKFRAFLRTEADASTVSTIQPCAIPGLVQTAEYATAMRVTGQHLSDPSFNESKAVAARIARQNLLTSADPLRLHALIDEGVVRRVVGGSGVMASQLHHLLRSMKHSNITVQVIPEQFGAYGSMSGPVTILGFDDPEDPDSVYLEYPGGGQWVDDRADVAKFTAMFADVAALALSESESAALIRARADELARDDEQHGVAQEHP